MGNSIPCSDIHNTQVLPLNLNDYQNYKDYKKILKHLLPTWYIRHPNITSNDYANIRNTWNLIYNNEIKLKNIHDNIFENISDITDYSDEENNEIQIYFIKTFYDRLFDIRPEFRQLFKNDIIWQGFKLVKMINFIIEKMDNDNETLQITFKNLINRHNNYGVKPDHYRIMMDNLLKILEKVLGTEYFNEESKYSWIKVISHLMNILVPIALNKDLLQHYNKHSICNH